MRLGYNTNGFASHRLLDAIDVIAEIGYRSVGLTLDHHALDPYAQNHDTAVHEVRDRLVKLDLECVVETGARFLLDPRHKHRPTLLDADDVRRMRRVDFLRRAIDTAAGLGARVVSLWSGVAGDPGDLDERLAGELRALCDYAADRDVVIGFEPEPGMYVENMAEFDAISARVDHPAFQLTLDVGHAHLTERDGAAATVRSYADRIVNVHLEGMTRPRHDHLVPWEGELDVLAVVDALRAIGYAGPATFELSRHSHAAVETARRAFQFIEAGRAKSL